MADPYAGIEYFPQSLPINTVVGRLGNSPGPAEAIPLAVLGQRLSPSILATTAILLGTYTSTVTDGTVVQTYGRTVVGDKGGGQFQYKASDTTSADNGGTIRVDSVGHRWFYISPAPPMPELFGAKGNAIVTNTAAITSGQHRVTDTGAVFTAADVNKPYAMIGAGAAGVTLVTTISAFVDATHVDLTAAAGTSVSSATAAYGNDDAIALAAFFTAQAKGSGEFNSTATGYLSTTKLSIQLRFLKTNQIPLVFAVNNITDNLLTSSPPINSQSDRVNTRFTYDKLWINAMATGLDTLVLTNGKPNLPGLTIQNSQRDPVLIMADGTGGAATATSFENLNGNFWIMENCGRHGLHMYLKCNTDQSVQTFINETLIENFSISGIGRRYGSGGAGTATAANGLRITYDNNVDSGGVTTNKLSNTRIINANWDALNGGAHAVDAIGDVIFHNAINGTTFRRIEQLVFQAGGVESSDGVIVTGAKNVAGNALVAGDWIECKIEAGIPFDWGYNVASAILSDPTDGNSFNSNSPQQGAMTFLPFKTRPTDGRALVSADAARTGAGLIDYNFRNSMKLNWWQGTLVASTNLTIDIPIYALSNISTFVQVPIELWISHSPYPDDATKWSYGRWVLLPCNNAGTPACYSKLADSQVSAAPAFSFIPANVTFAIASSSGSLFDIVRVTVPGGATVGSSALSDIVACASRFGIGQSEVHRLTINTPQFSAVV